MKNPYHFETIAKPIKPLKDCMILGYLVLTPEQTWNVGWNLFEASTKLEDATKI